MLELLNILTRLCGSLLIVIGAFLLKEDPQTATAVGVLATALFVSSQAWR